MPARRVRRRQRANGGRIHLHKGGAPADVDKRGIFGYPAGKTRLAPTLIKLIPEHRTYVEPFCGSAAVFFDKTRESEVEVLNDARSDLMSLYRDIAKLTTAELAALDKRDWMGNAETFRKLFKSKPSDRVGRVYRGLYLQRFSRVKDSRSGSFDTSYEGSRSLAMARVRQRIDRLKRARLYCGDYERVVRKFDSSSTFFFFDPPYVGYDANVGEREFDEERFVKLLHSLKGKFLVTYGVRGKTKFDGFNVRRIRDDKARNLSTVEGGVDTLLISNYTMSNKNASEVSQVVQLDDDEPGESVDQQTDLLRALASKAGPLPAVYQYQVCGDTLRGDLRLSVGDHLVGWALDVQRPGSIEKTVNLEFAESVAAAFSVDGDRYAKSLRGIDPIVATPKASHSLDWLDVDGEVQGPVAKFIVTVDRLSVERGLQSDDAHELFLTKGDRVNGIMLVRKVEDQWLASLSPSMLPSVLSKHAVESGVMPHAGCSALPATLEREVPPEFRYWHEQGETARKMRDALVASSWVTSDNVRIVNGEFRRIVTKLYLDDAPEFVEAPPLDWVERIAKAVGASSVVEVSESEAPDPDVLVYCDLGAKDEGVDASIDRAVGRFRKGEFVLSATDSPAARVALAKAGPVFKFRPDRSSGVEALERVFASSVPLRCTEGVEFVTVNVTSEIGKKSKHEGKTFNEHARAWVKSRGLLDPDSDYEGMLGKAVLRLAEAHSREGHSGMSALAARAYFNWLVDAWDGMNTLILSDKSAAKARAALAKCATAQIEQLVGGESELDAEQALLDKVLAQEIPIVKAERRGDERFVLGIVLEPETVDSQGDIYSAEEVRNTAHKFMAEYQQIGFMHQASLAGRVKILESYIAPAAFKLGEQTVKAGTWLLAVRVLDSALWKAIKRGEFTGFSIGGSAMRRPERRS